MDLQKLVDRAAIVACVEKSFRLVDDGQADKTALLFTQDARWTFGPGTPKPGTLQGAEIDTAMKARAALTHVTTRHALTNVDVELDGDEAAVRAIMTLYRSDDDSRSPVPRVVADLTDKLVRLDGHWLIRERLVMPVFGLV